MKICPLARARRAFLAAISLLVAANVNTAAQGARIRWSVEQVSETITAGSMKSVTISLRSSSDLSDVSLWLPPSISELVTVKPAFLASLADNEDQELTLTFSIPGGAEVGEVGGTLQVKRGDPTVPTPLNIHIVITARGN